jgi:hypothetical protein
MYYERLTLPTFLKSLHYILKDKRLVKNRTELFYFEASKICVAFINVISLLLPISFKRMDFKSGEITDCNGTNIGFRILYEDLRVVFQEIIKSKDYSNLLPAELNNSEAAFLKKNIGIALSTSELFEPESLWYTLLLIQVVAQHMHNEGGTKDDLLFLEKRCWMFALSSYSRHLGISMVPISYTFNLKPTVSSIKDRLRGNPIVSKIAHYKKIRSIPGFTSMMKPGKYRNGKHLTIIVDSILSKYTASSFWSQSTLPPKNVLFVSDSYPISENQWRDVKHADMDAVALKPWIATGSDVPIFLPHIDKKDICHGYTSRVYHSRERKFIRFHLDRFHYIRSYWLNLFRAYNARVYISQFKFFDKHIAVADAIHELGGVTAIWQEPFHEFSSPSALVKADLVFGFSPEVSNIERGNDSSVRYFVAIGYIGDYRFDMVRTKAQELRSFLRRNGAKKIIAFFDENSSGDERYGIGNASAQENYQFILEKVLSEPWFGVILKPKKPSTLKKRLGTVAEILEQAIETKRCYIYDQDYVTTPAEAAMASDIAIHDNLCAGTAGLESALAGVPTLMLDKYGWRRSRIYKLGEKKVVFQEWQPLWEALMEHWNGQTIPGFGDWLPIIDEFDPFRDGKAASRMGTYLHWLIQGYEKGQEREVILADAADKYCRRWGHDKVVQMS